MSVPAKALDDGSVPAASKPGGTNASRKAPSKEQLEGQPKSLATLVLSKAAERLGEDTIAQFKAPNPYPLKRIPPKVLEEEDYVEALSTIIERDYFPDLPRLRLEQQLLQAKSEGKEFLVHKLRERLANLPAATPAQPAGTPRPETPAAQTPGAASTPGGPVDLTRTPGPVGRGLIVKTLASGEQCVVNTNVRLDSFQTKYTSEDNASFEHIVKSDKEKRADNEWYFEALSTVHNAELHHMQLAVADGEKPSGVLVNRHQPRAHVHFYPQGEGGYVVHPHSKAKLVNNNTRFPTADQDGDGGFDAALARRRMRSDAADHQREAEGMAAKGKFGADGGSSKYPIMDTPRMDPEEMSTPLMTYGEVGSTPLLLEEHQMPQYKFPSTSAKEEKAHALAEDAVKRARDLKRRERASASKPWMGQKRSILTKTGTPATSRLGTPRSIFGRTPARTSVAGTPATVGGATPRTAGATPRTGAWTAPDLSGLLPPAKRPRIEPSSLPANITDGLL